MSSGDHDVRMQAGGWAIIIGAVGAGIGGLLSLLVGINPLVGAALGAVVGGGGVYVVVVNAANAAGNLAGRIYDPQGDTTPPIREYSCAQALVQSANYDEAVDAYELHHLEFPDDPEPCLRLARLHRDGRQDFAESVRWFQLARKTAEVSRGQELMILQELVELYTRKLKEPRRAMGELARLVDQFPDSPGALSAQEELASMRMLLAREQAGEGAFDDLFYAERERPG